MGFRARELRATERNPPRKSFRADVVEDQQQRCRLTAIKIRSTILPTELGEILENTENTKYIDKYFVQILFKVSRERQGYMRNTDE